MEKNRPASIAFVINVDWYFRLHWINRALALKKLGYNIYVITTFTDLANKKFFESVGFNCVDWSVSRSGLSLKNELISYRKLKKILSELKPDFIHSVTIKPNIYSGFISEKLSTPCIKSVTGLGIVFSKNTLKYKILKFFISFLYRISSVNNNGAFIFENKQDQNLFYKLKIGKSQASVHIAGAGVDTDKFNVNSIVLDTERIRVLFAARMLKEKGLDTLLSAVSLARMQGATIKLQVAGILDPESEGAYSLSEIKKLAEEFDFEWLGQIDDMLPIFSHTDVVALPTRYGEGIPRVLIEAGSCGRIVMTTNVGGCKEFISHMDDGLLVEPFDSQSMADFLVDMIVHPNKYQPMALELMMKVRKNYSDESVISKLINIYDELLSD